MHLKALLTCLCLYTRLSSATWLAYEEYTSNPPSKAECERPTISFHPNHPWHPLPSSPPRHKTCQVQSHDDMHTDDSAYILSALHACNNGGRVVFPVGRTYVIGAPMDMTFLHHVDIVIQGYVQFTNTTHYWQRHSFKQVYQNATTFFQLGGEDVNVYGGGMLDGNGQVWYDLYAKNEYVLRPVLFGTVGLHGGVVAGLRLRYSPQWYNFVANSTDVVFDSLDISGYSKSKNVAKNTDGWDVYRSSNVVIQNSVVNNGDDCVSFKPNSTEILVQNMHCNGSHGISVGSLGQYVGEVDIVQNVLVDNIAMSNATDGARIKVWPGSPAELSGDLQGGGGSGRVQNITYRNYVITNVDYAIEVTQCYGQDNLTLCNEYPSNLTISDVTMENFRGTTSEVFDPISGYVVCSSPNVCKDIEIRNVHVVAPSGKVNLFTCGDVEKRLLHGIHCTSVNKGGN